MKKDVYTWFLKIILSEKIGVEMAQIDTTEAFFTLGVSSIISTEIHNLLVYFFGELSSTILFQHPNVEKLSEFLNTIEIPKNKFIEIEKKVKPYLQPKMIQDKNGARTDESSLKFSVNEVDELHKHQIAIIGIGGHFPQADGHAAFFENLINRKDCIVEIPEDRWAYTSIFSKKPGDFSSIYNKWGGFIDDIDKFDPLFFKIAPSEAEGMDPQQKLFLEYCWHALEDAGYNQSGMEGPRNFGVYAGVTWNEFSVLTNEYGYLENLYKGPGSLYWGIPNRVSYFFDFTGPSLAIDTACSSSLVALHLACQGLLAGDCELALAGGINLNLHPAKYLFLCRSKFLSTDGRCRGFGKDGNGYVPGEGVGVVLLKPLLKAVEDGDHIYGVIMGTATNHGGKATGYTVPNPHAHKAVIQRAFREAGVTPEQVSYIECHGTGTELGDPIEITGLQLAFEEYTDKKQFCGIGTVKSNIGHLEAASGVAGLIKVLCSMQAETIPASLFCEPANPKINFSDSPFYLMRENQPWRDTPGGQRIAGISSFGAGGANAHCIIGAYQEQNYADSRAKKKYDSSVKEIIGLSAHHEDALISYVKRLADFLSHKLHTGRDSVLTLANIAFSLARKSTFSCRLAVIADNLHDLLERFNLFLEGRIDQKNIFYGKVSRASTGSSSPAGTLEMVAQAWVEGTVDSLPAAEKSGTELIPLPLYPFLKIRSWLHSASVLYQKSNNLSGLKKLHPLVDRNQSFYNQGRYSARLQRRNYYFADHYILDNPVLPGVCHLEIARFTAENYFKDSIGIIQDVWFTNKISLEENDYVDIRIDLTKEAKYIRFEIRSENNDSRIIYSQGKLRPATGMKGSDSPENLLPQINDRCQRQLSVEDFYRKFAGIGIRQKNSFRVVKEFLYNDTEALAKIELAAGRKTDFSAYSLHPTLLDGAVQTAMMHLIEKLDLGSTILPFHFSEIQLVRDLPDCIYVHAIMDNLDSKKYTIHIYDSAGILCMAIRGFVLKELKEKKVSAQSPQLLTLELQEANLVVPLEKEIPAGPVLLISDNLDTINLIMQNSGNFQLIPGLLTPKPDANTDVYKLNMAGTGYTEWLAELKQSGKQPEGIVCCFAELTPDWEQADNNVVEDYRIENLFRLVKAVLKEHIKSRLLYLSQSFPGTKQPRIDAVPAFFKSLGRETSDLFFRFIHIDQPVTVLALSGIIHNELLDRTAHAEVFYKNNKRFTRQLHEPSAQPEQSPEQMGFKNGDVCLIVGGLGGLGRIISRYLSAEYEMCLVLTGRSAAGPDKDSIIEKLAGRRNSISYIACDTTDRQAVRSLMARIRQDYGRLDGVIHCAGYLEDTYFIKKEWESFKRVLASKSNGLVILDKATQQFTLRYFILFSSISSVFGNAGQSDYAYANAFLDEYAFYREALRKQKKRSGRTLVFNWPYWQEGGMKLDQRQLKLYRDTFHTTPLKTQAGLHVLKRAMRLKGTQFVIMNIQNDKLATVRELLLTNQLPVSAGVKENQKDDLSGSGSSAEATSKLSAEDVRTAVTHFFKFIFLEELKIPEERLDLSLNLEEYGIDSIAMIDIINKLEKQKRFINLPKTTFMENGTLTEIIEYFTANYPAANYSI